MPDSSMANNTEKAGVTLLLRQWRAGDADALNQLTTLIYAELRNIAARVMRGEERGTLQATMIVNEAYLRLAKSDAAPQDRAHFMALAATVMRHVVLDWAKARKREKRGGGLVHETLHENSIGFHTDPATILEVDRLLSKLDAFDPRKARIVELVFFVGLTYAEAAEAAGVSEVTIQRELKFAKAWMRMELERGGSAL